MKEKLKVIANFFANPRLLLCLGLAWMITNGWSYVMVGIGTLLGIGWMIAVGTAYLALLWVPFTPEKIITFFLAILLLKWLFPKDQKTLGLLLKMRDKAKLLWQRQKDKWQNKDGTV